MAEINKKKMALQFIILFGFISALGDITYEGARSVYGPYLGFLGASALVIGIISGFGEFLGYILRLISGYIADKTGRYWTVTIIGYGMLVSVPLLAVAGRWEIAAIFIILERVGKAVRSPGKDAMLSYATKQVGTGFGFGLHEALDQIGAVVGPLIFTGALLYTGNYGVGFGLTVIPVILLMVIVLTARYKVPDPSILEDTQEISQNKQANPVKTLSKTFWLYSIFTFASVLGFVAFPLLSFHYVKTGIIPEAYIPILYSGAMVVDAVTALVIGKLYDKVGLNTLYLIPLLTGLTVYFGFMDNLNAIIVSVVLWGIVMGTHETIMRAGIADITGIKSRGTAYGIFNTLYGLAMLFGSVVLGYLYSAKLDLYFAFVLVVEIIAVIIFMTLRKSMKG